MSTPPPAIDLPPAILRAQFAALAKAAVNARRPVRVQRAVAAAGLKGLPCAPGTRRYDDVVGGVPGRRIHLVGPQPGALLYLHGGGYVIGSARGEETVASHLAAGLGLDGFSVDYRLAPEHPFPAALDDALAAYEGLLEQHVPAGRIVVAGESAGGGLSLALAVALRDRGRPLPAMVGLLCPWLDLRAETVARADAPREPLLNPAVLERWASAYAGATDRADPGLSPLLADLAGLPPVHIQSGADDPLKAEGDELERRLHAAGGQVHHAVHPKMMHGYVIACGISRTARNSLEEVAAAGRDLLRGAA